MTVPASFPSPELLAVARGDRPADLVLRNARLVNVFSGQIELTDIAIFEQWIAGIGPGYRAAHELDLRRAYVTPGLIDAHVHIESSLCLPAQFAAAVVPHGVTTAVIDPHEVANVAGLAGVRFMAEASRNLPLQVVIMASSCVPATHMETSGAVLDAAELAQLLAEGTVHGLAEVMNYPAVIHGDEAVLAKLRAFAGRPQDGHAPQIVGQPLNAYVAAGIGSDHECTTVAEAQEKLARGLYILIREATNARNLHNLLPLITPENHHRLCFCTDDRIPSDLIDQGSIDYMVAEAIHFGVDPVMALRMATLNTAEWFGLRHVGAIAPGRRADLLVVDNLRNFRPRQVYAAGQLVAEEGKLIENTQYEIRNTNYSLPNTIRVDLARIDLRIPARGAQVRVISATEGSLLTEQRILPARVIDGLAVADPERDLLKMAVIERHGKTASSGGASAERDAKFKSNGCGLGFIQGFDLKRGAIAGTVAHDHHNLVVIGCDDLSMRAAAQAVVDLGGGLVVHDGERVIANLPLPVAGLMSDLPVAEVRARYDALIGAARALGCEMHDPFMAMSFMALEVIPTLKLTDKGLVDVEQFALVDLFVT